MLEFEHAHKPSHSAQLNYEAQDSLIHGARLLQRGIGVAGLQLRDQLVDLRAHLRRCRQAAFRSKQRVEQLRLL